jgi:hypothetical protein
VAAFQSALKWSKLKKSEGIQNEFKKLEHMLSYVLSVKNPSVLPQLPAEEACCTTKNNSSKDFWRKPCPLNSVTLRKFLKTLVKSRS